MKMIVNLTKTCMIKDPLFQSNVWNLDWSPYIQMSFSSDFIFCLDHDPGVTNHYTAIVCNVPCPGKTYPVPHGLRSHRAHSLKSNTPTTCPLQIPDKKKLCLLALVHYNIL